MHFRMLLVKDIYDDNIEALSYTANLFDVISYNMKHSLDRIPVINDKGKLIGYILTKDLPLDTMIDVNLCIKEMIVRDLTHCVVNVEQNAESIEDHCCDSVFVVNNGGMYLGVVKRIDYYHSEISYFNTYFTKTYGDGELEDLSLDGKLKLSEKAILTKKLKEQKHLSNVLNTVLETVYDGIIVVDKDGYITMISKTYKQFLGLIDKQIIGKHVTEVVENTRMHIVVKTGVPEIADIQKIKGSYMVASRLPMWENGKVTGAVGKVLFRNVSELFSLHNKISLMEKKIEEYKDELQILNMAKYKLEDIIGMSKLLNNTKTLALKASKTSSNVLIVGESGTGKELIAHAIHNAGNRVYGPFIKVNCAAIPNELMESELFGYEEGAFTGAKKGGRIGKFELANGGTIFLDEIGDMPIYMQSKLLRVIQEREIERIGGTYSKKIDVRIIAATNKNLEQLVLKHEFREDLYYRLNVFLINVPSLRERPEDIRLLSEYFLRQLNTKYLKRIKGISENAISALIDYNWPGNIRELENVIERAVNLVEYNGLIDTCHIPDKISDRDIQVIGSSLKDIIEKVERQAILQSLKVANGNRSKAANLLGIGRTTFYEKLDRYKLK